MECAPDLGQLVKLMDLLEDAHEKEKKDIFKRIQTISVKGT